MQYGWLNSVPGKRWLGRKHSSADITRKRPSMGATSGKKSQAQTKVDTASKQDADLEGDGR